MHSRFGSALAAIVLALAPAGPATGSTVAGAIPGTPRVGAVTAAECTVNCVTVAVAITGNGSGRVQSTDAQFAPDGIIDCPVLHGIVNTTLCSHKYAIPAGADGVQVYLRSTPDPGSQLCDSMGCTTAARTQQRLFSTSGTVPANFSALAYDVNLARAGTGKGRIMSDPPYLDCGTACSTSLEYGEQLVFTAKANAGSRFSKWTGDCAGQNATCEITLTGNITTAAVFNLVVAATPAPTPEPTQEPTEPPVEPSPTTVPETLAPTVAPTVVVPIPTPTEGPVVPVAETGAAGVPIVIGIALVLLLAIGAGTALAMRRQAPPPA